MLWVNGTHDVHYVLDSYAKSAALVKSPKAFRIQPRMPHGHQPGWAPAEIGIFVDSYLKGGTPLAIVDPITLNGTTVTLPYKSPTLVVSAELHYTVEKGLRSERKWITQPASIQVAQIVAEGLPDEANTWIITLVDERGAMISSDVGLR